MQKYIHCKSMNIWIWRQTTPGDIVNIEGLTLNEGHCGSTKGVQVFVQMKKKNVSSCSREENINIKNQRDQAIKTVYTTLREETQEKREDGCGPRCTRCIYSCHVDNLHTKQAMRRFMQALRLGVKDN